MAMNFVSEVEELGGGAERRKRRNDGRRLAFIGEGDVATLTAPS